MTTYAFTLPFAVNGDDVLLLMGQRNLLQKWSDGKSVQGIIPEWAGQWGLIGGPGKSGEAPKETAIRTFKEQTGLDLSDPHVQSNFLLSNQAFAVMNTAEQTKFNILSVFTTLSGLQLLDSVVADTLHTPQISEGILSEIMLVTGTAAQGKIGPAPEPSGGWQKYLITNYYGGTAPGQLNTEINTLTTQISQSAAQEQSFFKTALDMAA